MLSRLLGSSMLCHCGNGWICKWTPARERRYDKVILDGRFNGGAGFP